uniref:Uncharacterized protein n=1 Tax=Rhizophora mucronata TaxID=61149 RepID=A0A2P2Q332_RHIMU
MTMDAFASFFSLLFRGHFIGLPMMCYVSRAVKGNVGFYLTLVILEDHMEIFVIRSSLC